MTLEPVNRSAPAGEAVCTNLPGVILSEAKDLCDLCRYHAI